ncbi:MAG: HD-GYP domain-containing protein [Rhodoferax sp.]|uniref:HD-GYP domain-containing protein n=1 Tax=Rhodoferax sp. TaxID=50421 RepID=UPI0017CDDB14|nr:HD-GYP domain-containing protein [Rhodoferax sp.]NMM14571.1 HD-GYP domain-containing protein [Rhodoferax sp.]
MQALKLSELMGALSHALDITEGQPEGHCVRCCWIGMHIGQQLGLPTEQLWELYYTLLLKDLGCSSNASRICELYLTDDLSFKRDFKWVDGSLPQVLRFVLRHTGPAAAAAEVQHRRGKWFDPELVDAFLAVASAAPFWATLNAADLETQVFAMEPGGHEAVLDEDYLDDIAEAFGQVVDAKSPFTAGHSARVGLYTALLGESMEIPEARRRWLKRGALLHDVGKLGVSNAILDKPGKLDEAEWAAVRRHAVYTESILGRIQSFDELARVSAAHHERLDGGGYPRGLQAADITLETRIITTADIFDAITAERPYRSAVPVEKTLAIMADTVGTAIDATCFAHLKKIIQAHPEFFPG